MSKLSERVKKAKQLRIIPAVSGDKGCYNTYGSNDDLYKICLRSGYKNIVTPDGYRPTKIFYTSCQKSVVNVNNPYQESCQVCKGNNRHTVCYHCLGTIRWSLKSVGLQVSFFETYHDAVNGLNFGGTLAKIENQNGTGAVWCVYRKVGDKKKKQQFVMLLPEQKKDTLPTQSDHKNYYAGIGSPQENIRIMRGQEDEGID